jgi:hypothetical protein
VFLLHGFVVNRSSSEMKVSLIMFLTTVSLALALPVPDESQILDKHQHNPGLLDGLLGGLLRDLDHLLNGATRDVGRLLDDVLSR